jgi:hypothetical protein
VVVCRIALAVSASGERESDPRNFAAAGSQEAGLPCEPAGVGCDITLIPQFTRFANQSDSVIRLKWVRNEFFIFIVGRNTQSRTCAT